MGTPIFKGLSAAHTMQLVLAAESGDNVVVRELLAAGANLKSRHEPSVVKISGSPVSPVNDSGNLSLHVQGTTYEAPLADWQRTAMQAAAAAGHQDVVTQLIEAGAEVDAEPAEMFGRTALQAAVESGHVQLVNQLLAAGAGVNAPPAQTFGRTALQCAAEVGHPVLVNRLMDAGALVNAEPGRNSGRTALQAAAQGGHLDIVGTLLKAGATINAEPGWMDGRTALQVAAQGGHIELLNRLIAAGADINADPGWEDGRTALQAAAEGGHLDLVNRLIMEGANIDAKPSHRFGRTALQAASQGGHREIVNLLITGRADVNEYPADEGGVTALQAAARSGHLDLVVQLLAAGADANADPAQEGGRTAIQAAAEGGHLEVVHKLIAAGAEINAEPAQDSGRTALQAAAEGGYLELTNLLISAGAEIDAKPAENLGRTALQAAAEHGHLELVNCLLAAGANINAEPADDFGKTALQAAVEGGYAKVVERLLHASAAFEWNDGLILTSVLPSTIRGGSAEVLKLLMKAGVAVDRPDKYGRIILHGICEQWNEKEIGRVLGLGKFKINARDNVGSTPLHAALLARNVSAATLLIYEGVDININDYEGSTPLHLALDNGLGEIVSLLLEKGANTDHLELDKISDLLSDSIAVGDWTVVTLDENLAEHGRAVRLVDLQNIKGTICDDWASRSVFLPIEMPVVSWAWRVGEQGPGISSSRFSTGSLDQLPTPSELQTVELVGFVSFDAPILSMETTAEPDEVTSSAPDDSPPVTVIKEFSVDSREIGISWIMRESLEIEKLPTRAGMVLRSVKYIGTLSVKYRSLPRHAVEFFISLLDDLHRTWLRLISAGNLHLMEVQKAQLNSGGADPANIMCLLKDSQQWNTLRIRLKNHLLRSKSLLLDFKSQSILHPDLVDSIDIPKLMAFGGDEAFARNIKAIRELSAKIQIIEDECKKGITSLQTDTKEMIQLEFNLVSIFEARKSLGISRTSLEISRESLRISHQSMEMSLMSNSVAISMKRLIYFLAVDGLFGMNMEHLIESTIGLRLRSIFGKVDNVPPDSPVDSDDEQQSTVHDRKGTAVFSSLSADSQEDVGNSTNWVRRRRRGQRGDEESQLHGTTYF
ncbi:hypothetical protein Q9L58_006546 [Maublancomyces gigas]|uniref:Ankyrin repeat protein n=1 Tax=Discina gigas TaxID=1032678 RepID=A0ABR3GFK1_9PEZI